MIITEIQTSIQRSSSGLLTRADGDYKYYGDDSLVKLIQNWIFLWFPHIQGSPILKKVICDFGEDNLYKNVWGCECTDAPNNQQTKREQAKILRNCIGQSSCSNEWKKLLWHWCGGLSENLKIAEIKLELIIIEPVSDIWGCGLYPYLVIMSVKTNMFEEITFKMSALNF